MRFSRLASSLLGVVVVVGGAVISGSAAQAATGSGYGAWTVSGSSRAFTGTVTLPTGFPAVTFTSDSRAAVNIATSATQPATSSFGQVFGSSSGEQYIGLRPSGSAGTVSTTTYTFASPTPSGTWGIALGDIDAESLTIAATGADGAPVGAEDLGFGSAANALGGADTLTVTETATGYVVEDEQCPDVPARCDTGGATAWFQPAVPLSTLTVTSAYVSGAPVYQTWFATLVRSISGTVSVPADIPQTAPPVVDLSDGSGTTIASTPVDADGGYLFDGLAARADYSVAISPDSIPDGAVAPEPVAIDTASADVTGADLAIAPDIPAPIESVTGTITDPSGSPVAGVGVEISGRSDAGDLVDESSVTDAAGAFAIDIVPDGRYTVELTPPAETGLAPVTTTLQVGPGARVLEFVLSETTVVVPDPGVPSPSVPGVPSEPGELAATGASPAGPLTLALVLSASGLVVLSLTRRRRDLSGERAATGRPVR